MVYNRIRVAKDKAELVQSLLNTNNKTAPFQTYADIIAFAAALGTKRKKRVSLGEISQSEPAPIGLEIFVSRGYDLVMNLLAIAETHDPKILSPLDPIAEAERLQIFEEYANGGLEVLQEELRGAVDYTERLLLIMSQERYQTTHSEEEFDLSRFL